MIERHGFRRRQPSAPNSFHPRLLHIGFNAVSKSRGRYISQSSDQRMDKDVEMQGYRIRPASQ